MPKKWFYKGMCNMLFYETADAIWSILPFERVFIGRKALFHNGTSPFVCSQPIYEKNIIV